MVRVYSWRSVCGARGDGEDRARGEGGGEGPDGGEGVGQHWGCACGLDDKGPSLLCSF